MIERLQPDALPTKRLYRFYGVADRLIGGTAGLVVGLAITLIGILNAASQFGIVGGLDNALRVGMTSGLLTLLVGILCGGEVRPQSIAQMHVGQLSFQVLVYGSLIGTIVGTFYKMYFDLPNALTVGLIASVFGVLAIALAGTTGLRPRNIILVETLGWNWQRAWSFMLGGIGVGFLIGSLIGVSYDMYGGIGGKLIEAVGGWYGPGLFGAIGGGIIGMLGGSLVDELGLKTHPNQGIWRSTRSAAWIGTVGSVTIGIFTWLIIRLADPGYAVTLGAGAGLVNGFIVGMAYGGYAVLSHFVFRFILYRNGSIPWNYARFLDYCAERVFLRKVGGGYIFIHRMLMEYFASLTPEEIESLAQEAKKGGT